MLTELGALTRKQREVFEYLRRRAHGGAQAPTLDELCAALSLRSRGSMHKHVSALVSAGLVEPMQGKQRGVRLSLAAAEVSARGPAAAELPAIPSPDVVVDALRPLPLLGRIAAGKPLEAVSDIEELVVPPMLRTEQPCYVLRVRGDSMVEDGILDGDLVVIESRDYARNGEIVVALIDGQEATLKRIVQRPGQVELWPANANMDVMRFAPDRIVIQGVVVGQMRTYR